jgi:hypothetical protein
VYFTLATAVEIVQDFFMPTIFTLSFDILDLTEECRTLNGNWLGLLLRLLAACLNFLEAWHLCVQVFKGFFLRSIFHSKRTYSNTYRKDSAGKNT